MRVRSPAVPSSKVFKRPLVQPSKRMAIRTTHEERTATERREAGIHVVTLAKVEQILPNIRLLRLKPRNVADEEASVKARNVQFLPGQWLDVHVPNIPQAGGFTITSTPHDLKTKGYLELAIQLSPRNPPAAWLWQKQDKIEGSELIIRVGGSFVWPPHGIDIATIENLVLVAGGVGINPLVSMLSHLHQNPKQMPPRVKLIYSGRRGPSGSLGSLLFLDRIRKLFAQNNISSNRSLEVFYTGSTSPEPQSEEERNMTFVSQELQVASLHPQKIWFRRISGKDLLEALGPADKRSGTVAYICGPPTMTDWVVGRMKAAEGMREERVLCEKWW